MINLLPCHALSVRQPWAWAIIHAGKDIENRSAAAFNWARTGPVAIHAAKGMTRDEYEDARHFMLSIGIQPPHPRDLIRGAIIGTANVTELVSSSDSEWFFGPVGLHLVDACPLDPIACKGALGLFTWQATDTEPDPARPWMQHWPHTPPRQRSIPKSETRGLL
jgi:hypothetical protein